MHQYLPFLVNHSTPRWPVLHGLLCIQKIENGTILNFLIQAVLIISKRRKEMKELVPGINRVKGELPLINQLTKAKGDIGLNKVFVGASIDH